MGVVVLFEAGAGRSPTVRQKLGQRMPYESYLAHQQAEAAFRALYLGYLG